MARIVCQFSQLTQQFDSTPVFSGLAATLGDGLTGLVGRNGQGKSVLLALLAQAFPPTGGAIRWFVPFDWVGQGQLQGLRLADALGVGPLYDSFLRIQSGSVDEQDFARMENLWHLPALWEQALCEAGLDLPLSAPVQHLSGGEHARLALCRVFLQPDHYLLLDEPSNHLDVAGRQWLLGKLSRHPGGALIATHDRELLQQVGRILELNTHGLDEYGGNYTLYQAIRAARVNAAEQQLANLKHIQHQQKLEQQAALKKAAQRRKQGEQQRGSQSKLLLDARKNRAESSFGKLRQQHQQRNGHLHTELQAVQERLEIIRPQILRTASAGSRHRLCLHVSGLRLPYVRLGPLSFTVRQGERWHIQGRNGSGKSTLLRVIAGLEPAVAGNCETHARCIYLDQHFSLLDADASALANLLRLRPDISEERLRTELAGVRLRGDKALQAVKGLSSGERLKTALLAVLLGETAPDLLLLDEPDNYLDLDSRLLLEQTLANYPGALLIVSHDPAFISALDTRHSLLLPLQA
ncbi:ATP-binding cassette domain-containing protein [Candidatus Thiothrix sp. Deng01]|uniref:ATP-binding cassette domain-containing protein n=1 Tax=Candidatus Thiothrix phosphatis TaxID=3112415 RepID=A0ABU6CZW7_9GAMM|nr:ATP-binding cassette domain-containing protein [Candidatus Thiothrix sp. Deng01]MEB4592365.1 ATP-binding cassette domain-containing protein [Candidatus Thiothrix sp. Deng01]